MSEEKIKEAFVKTKRDILSLYSQLYSLKEEIQELKRTLSIVPDRQISPANQQTHISTHLPTENPTDRQTDQQENSAIQQINPAHPTIPTHSSTDNYPYKPLKSPISNISTGNEGVPTDRQTNQQTDTSTRNQGVKVRLSQNTSAQNPTENQTYHFISRIEKPKKIDHLEKVAEFLDSLDDIKKELRTKIKHLTKQEMAVFTAIYQLEEQGFIVDYALLAEKLSLTESSIRDYAMRIIKKGIPVDKSKENNKKIILSISQNLKKIASLATILQLKEL